MKKWFVLCLAVCALAFGLTACSDLKEDIVGNWTVAPGYEDVDREVYPEKDTITFYRDGTFESGRLEGTYLVEDGYVTLSSDRLAMDYRDRAGINDQGQFWLRYPGYDPLYFVKN